MATARGSAGEWEMDGPLVSAPWLEEHLGDADLVLVDCRFDLADAAAGRRAYLSGHIPGAVFLDLELDLSGPRQEHGGRHPLPSEDAGARTFGSAGIDDATRVVCYDGGGAVAARLWWMLRYLGHDAVAVLDGGVAGWCRAGGELTSDLFPRRRRVFTPRPRRAMVATMEEVRHRAPGTVLIDARPAAAFRGETALFDTVPGRIPGAVNGCWQEGMRADGTWSGTDDQRRRFAGLPEGSPVISYCGSGVLACAAALSLEIAGRTGVRVYVGSYSDWISHPDNGIARGVPDAGSDL